LPARQITQGRSVLMTRVMRRPRPDLTLDML
jgi:hypothetical protein